MLLTHDDLSDRKRYLNGVHATNLLGVGVVPVVNENDTVVTDEIRFGDNDTWLPWWRTWWRRIVW